MEVNETNRPLTETPETEVSEVSVSTVEEPQVAYEPKQTKSEVIQRLKEINENMSETDKQEVDQLKQTFYKLHKAEQEAARNAFI